MKEDVTENFIKSFDAHSDELFRFAYFRIRDRELAKDLVQDSFIRTWNYITAGNEIENFRAFLYRTLRNIIVDETRKKKSVSLDVLQDTGFDPVDSFRKHELEYQLDSKNIIDKLSALEEGDREIIVMRFINELGPKEIAEILDESENVVSVRINRALKKAREIFQASTQTPTNALSESNNFRPVQQVQGRREELERRS